MRSVRHPDTVSLPTALVWHGDVPLITFGAVPVAAFARPFLDGVLSEGKVTGFAPLDSFARTDADLGIAGAIHHMSRCGSTLLCRQFGALPRVMALSEPFMFQHLLEGPSAPPAVTRRRLRQLAAAWRDGLAPLADRLVIKWPGLLAQHAATLADAFPEVPMLFLHRHAIEVLASVAHEPLGGARHLRPHHLFGAAAAGRGLPTDPLETSARLLARNCRTAAGCRNLATLDYADLPAAAWRRVAPYFGLPPEPGDIAAMEAAAVPHAKARATTRFVPDSAAKRASADARIRALAETILAPARAELLDRTPPLALCSSAAAPATPPRGDARADR